MDTLLLSRIQFAVAIYFHYLFVPLTLGLSVMVAIMETIWVRRGDEDYLRMAKFWGKLLLVNFAVGVVTGITLEFQFGTNWSRYSAYVGDIFGSLLAIEATVAFFLESTFIAVWFFGWNKLSPKAHAATIWLVAIASNVSAFWILAANAWMQHPVGFTIRNGRAELTDFFAVITQKFAILELVHTIGGAYILAGFFVLGISSWHLLRRNEVALFGKSFRIAAVWTLVFAFFEIAQGHMNAEILGSTQPSKMAAMETHWETGTNVPLYLVAWPDEKNERNVVEALPVPSLLSLLATYTTGGEVKGLRDYPAADRPPVLPIFLSFRAMVGLAFLFLGLGAWAWWVRKRPLEHPLLLKLLPWTIALPYLANELGWTVAELGRQPWIVYGIMRTSDAVSPVSAGQVMATLVGFVLLYTLLGAVDFFLLFKLARKGPAPAGRG
ncbi:MAG TPA: cytochrome ubiquinol oxidase subunit I [Thermoanaerobaculaceae bacterium]|nr:cytochrome ubiquinol oxidase subunit I [Acidobacteriota bacterium]NLH09942.1 cytochrome ubiquinol oxidase subunit I [Holophagae bacterium]HPW54864.1 cytochrome ubiquinol oxidase subunit I [Thermoanaerobaculaceae bacterium]